MNIIKPNITKKKQQTLKQLSKKLYKLCFDDNAEFVDFYFQKRYAAENNFVILNNEEPVAALQAIPYTMTFFDRQINIAYLSAICTHPDFRNQGLMTQLLAATHRQLFTNHVHAAILIPAELWLFDIYKKYDFETIFYRSKYQINTVDLIIRRECTVSEYKPVQNSKIFEYFTREMNKRNFCVQHSFEDFETVCEDISKSNGTVLIAECENKISGMCFAIKLNDTVAVIERFADNQEIIDSLFKTVSQKMQTDNIVCFDFPEKCSSTDFGMLRIICVEKMLQFYAITHPHCKKNISVKDSIINENNGFYTISNAQCKKLPLANEKNAWNIAQLTRFIFAHQTPYMSLMMNE
jgi:predicted acetyltransferase